MKGRDNNNLKGIDISNWQGFVNFDSIKSSGIQVVYTKATEGTYYIDRFLDINVDGAKQRGLNVGVYHYYRPSYDPIAQADFFVNAVKGKEIDCKLVLDIETQEGKTAEDLTADCIKFLERVKELTGKEVCVYTYTNFAQNNFTTDISSYPLWIAHYGVNAPSDNGIWNDWVGFQYSEKGSVPGVDGNCDMDEFTTGILLGGSVPTPSNPNPPLNSGDEYDEYTVQSGDTLTSIGRKFGVSFQEFAVLNNISNPNYIHVGQVLKIPGTQHSNNSNWNDWDASLQRTLNDLGYRDENGNSLTVDGVAGKLTHSACPTLREGAENEVVRRLQEKLESLGYELPSGVDGDFGNETEEAVITYQDNKGLDADGVVGPKTWGELLGVEA